MHYKNKIKNLISNIAKRSSYAADYITYQIFQSHYSLVGIEINEDSLYLMKILKYRKNWVINTFDKETLPDNVIKLSPLEPNILDMESIIQVVRNLWSRNSLTDKNISLLIPDRAVIIFIIKLEKITSHKELNRLIQWKLRKSIPFPIEQAKISWMPLSFDRNENKLSILVSLIKQEVLMQYEKIGRCLDADVGLVDISFFNLFNYIMMITSNEEIAASDFLVINYNGSYVSLGLFNDNELALYKSRTLLQKSADNINEYKNEILKELHPLIMYYFDQLGRKNLQCAYLKAGNDIIKQILQEKYGFNVIIPKLYDKLKVSDDVKLDVNELIAHTPLIGLLLGRRMI